jgi:hypothetical protein
LIVPTDRVYIAANIIDSSLIDGPWGDAVIDLINRLSPSNVHLSIYGSPSAALDTLRARTPCNNTIVSASNDPIVSVPSITLPSGQNRTKRIAYLSQVRNRALAALDASFDRILFLNDVIFSANDAIRLLSTNGGSYRAACAVDFINPFKMYDTFATRDLEGYSMGVPIFPWFTGEGSAESRQDVLDGKEAVRVRSCWGGMVAFEAKWFYPKEDEHHSWGWHDAASQTRQPGETSVPVRFRYEAETFWDASECCLVHADLQYPRNDSGTGIYMNPFVRVAYDVASYRWLGFVRRFERLFYLPQAILNRLVGLPYKNPRRTEVEGEEIIDEMWVYDSNDWMTDKDVVRNGKARKVKGAYQKSKRIAQKGGFCGVQNLLVLREDNVEGETPWEGLPVPPRPV